MTRTARSWILLPYTVAAPLWVINVYGWFNGYSEWGPLGWMTQSPIALAVGSALAFAAAPPIGFVLAARFGLSKEAMVLYSLYAFFFLIHDAVLVLGTLP